MLGIWGCCRSCLFPRLPTQSNHHLWVATFAGPSAEAGTETVRRCKASRRIALCLDPAQRRGERHAAEYLLARRRKDERVVKFLFLQPTNRAYRYRATSRLYLLGTIAVRLSAANYGLWPAFSPEHSNAGFLPTQPTFTRPS